MAQDDPGTAGRAGDGGSRRPKVTVELVYFDGCPNWRTADRHLRTLAPELDFVLEHSVVAGPEDAEAVGLRGSPTILVDGRDPFVGGDEGVGVSCRVYPTPDGPAGSPTLDQLRRALDA